MVDEYKLSATSIRINHVFSAVSNDRTPNTSEAEKKKSKQIQTNIKKIKEL
jgi:hypothetical protein